MPKLSDSRIHESIREYYDSQASRFGKNFRASQKAVTVDAIHDMRVAVKRIRALLELLAWVDGAFDPKAERKTIKRLYKGAGKVRDHHVMQELARDYGRKHQLEVSEYYNFLVSAEEKCREKYLGRADEFDINVVIDLRKKVCASLDKSEKRVTHFRTQQRLSHQVGKLLEYRNLNGFDQDDLHSIRKLSKEARYTLEILQTSLGEDDGLRKLNSLLRDCHRSLGMWHDAQVARNWLSGYLKDNASRPLFQPDDYVAFSKALEADQNVYLKQFETVWIKLSDFVGSTRNVVSR